MFASSKGKAKMCQVHQVLLAIDRLKELQHEPHKPQELED